MTDLEQFDLDKALLDLVKIIQHTKPGQVTHKVAEIKANVISKQAIREAARKIKRYDGRLTYNQAVNDLIKELGL